MKMKKLLLGLVLTTSALTAITSCSKDDKNNDDNSSTETQITFKSDVDVQLTRSTLQNTQIVSGQNVGVVITPNNTPSSYLYNNEKITADGDGFFGYDNVMYYPQNGDNINIYAYHPYQEDYSAATSSDITFTTSANQAVKANYLSSDVLYAQSLDIARSKNPIPLTFAHKMSKIVYTIQKGNGADISGLNSIVLQNALTQAELNLETGVVTTVSSSDRANLSAYDVIGGVEGVDKLAGACLILPPQTFPSGTELLKINVGTATYTYTTTSELTFDSGKRYNFIITVNMDGLTLQSTITDWDNGGAIEGEGTIE